MVTQDAAQLKEKIMNILRLRGPGLPVRIAHEIGLSPLFTSAFLSEILSEKRIKLSHMRVGSSPLYFIPGQEPKLETFSHHLKSKERDAFVLLKEKKFLNDKSQEPAIRVALRSIRDFAIPFRHEEEIYWRFFTTPESEFIPQKQFKPLPKQEISPPKQVVQETETDEEKIIRLQIEQDKKTARLLSKEPELNIFDEEKPIIQKQEEKSKNEEPSTPKRFKSIKKIKAKNDDKFFNKVKEYLQKEDIDLIDIEGFNKNEIILKVKQNSQEKLLLAFNKKRITEEEITKASKKALEYKLNYIILSFGEPMKKLQNLIEALKNLSNIKKIE